MSFLDNLENNLKALEGQEQGGLEDGNRRDRERADALAAAPWAEKLKTGDYAKNLVALASKAGFARRIKVNLAWIGTTLRLDAKGLKLELRPVPKGVDAVFCGPDRTELRRVPVKLDGDPAKLVGEWIADVERAAAAEKARTAAMAEEDVAE